ncbi:hypothetical protein GOP47_0006957 [Adiantum capillus-veneris]|uniref:Enkurin domain-containing protein n=1 Tax=Adiantum capillus-veneris TaxID=13818 RepID=A0A9D4V0N5_ADICA|nr:hypothetical protein GOP47_0006957 [Adiantum capillus-veneris]
MLRDNVESVYNLIPPPPSSTDRKHVYPKSKYNKESDTFMTCAKSRRSRATFGHPNGSLNPRTNEYLRKYSWRNLSPFVIRTPKVHIKPPIPLERARLRHRRVDFINNNGYDMVYSYPSKTPTCVWHYVDKNDYGKVPEYLVKFNEDLKEKQTKAREDGPKQQGIGTQPNTRRLEEWEKKELIEGLKKKWQQVNTTYQKTTVTLDTWAKKARKERFEDQLMEIERDIQTLSRRVVLVVDNGKSQSSSSYSSGKRKHLVSHW